MKRRVHRSVRVYFAVSGNRQRTGPGPFRRRLVYDIRRRLIDSSSLPWNSNSSIRSELFGPPESLSVHPTLIANPPHPPPSPKCSPNKYPPEVGTLARS